MAKYGVKEVADIIVYDLGNNKPVLFLDTLKMTNIENTAESSDARGGKGNPKLLTWDFNREATVQMQDALMSEKSIAILTGNAVTTGSVELYKRQVLITVAGSAGKSKVTLSETPIANSINVNEEDDVTEVATFTVATADVEFATTDVPVGDTVVVYYRYMSGATAQTIKITSDSFPQYVKIVGDTVIRNAKTGQDEPFQIIIHKAKIQPNFTLTFQADGDPTIFDMNLDVYRKDENTDMITLVKY